MVTYSTFKVSNSPPTVLALQAWRATDRPIVSCVFPVTAIADWDAKDVASGIGFMMMVSLSNMQTREGEDSPIDQYPSLRVLNTKRRLEGGSNDCPPTRPEHLRVSVIKGKDRLLIQRCVHESVGETVASLSLPRIALAGNAVAGEALLHAMNELYPDVFAPFPGLLSK